MESIDALKRLHKNHIDSRKGYETAHEDAEAPDMKALFQRMADLHGRLHDDLHALLTQRGEHPDDDGTFMSTVHKTIISVRSAVTGLSHGSLSSFASGEESILNHYDDAISANAGDANVLSVLRNHRDLIAQQVSEMKRLAA